jgi:hypothetical protein
MRFFKIEPQLEIYGAKAHKIKDINCPDLKVGAIEACSFTGL